MKSGLDLVGLATEIQRQRAAKADYVAPVEALSVRVEPDAGAFLALNGHGSYALNGVAHRQLGEYAGLRADYYDRLLEAGPKINHEGTPLYDVTVNALLRTHAGDKRLVRTLDTTARALLSDGYRPIDHDEIAERVLPTLGEFPGIDWSASSFDITERRLYMKVVNARMQGEVKVGDAVQAGVVITNSETGQGSFAVQPLVFRLVCRNGMIRSDLARRKYHTGGRLTSGEGEGDGLRFFRDDTLRARNEATVLEMRDLIRGALTEDVFGRILNDLREAAGVKVEGDPVKVVERVQQRFSLTDAERGGVLSALIQGADLSLYGLSNALTRHAQDVPSYDRSTEMEAFGGQLLTLPRAEVRELVSAN